MIKKLVQISYMKERPKYNKQKRMNQIQCELAIIKVTRIQNCQISQTLGMLERSTTLCKKFRLLNLNLIFMLNGEQFLQEMIPHSNFVFDYSNHYFIYNRNQFSFRGLKIIISTMDNNDDMANLPFEKLFELGEEKYNQMDYEEAQYYYSIAYQKKPHEDIIILCYANILKHNNKAEDAKKILRKSLKDNPNGTYKRFFQLAEIQNGEKSIKLFQQGIEAAKKCFQNPFLTTTPSLQVKRDIAQAYASIAQVCMTDLANVPFEQVQSKCAEVLEKGKNMDPSCMDIYLQIANCCIEKDENQLAKNSLLIIKQSILQQKQEYEDQLITQCAKYFMEINEFQSSVDILEKLNESQNNNPETVYLMAFCSYQMGKYTECKQYIQDYAEGQMIDQEVDEAMKQLKIELSKKIKKNGEETQEGNEEIDEEQQWMDVQDDVQQ